MKHNIFNKRMSLALASMLVASGVASAQEMADTTKVNVAFGQVSKADLMGGVSEVNASQIIADSFTNFSRLIGYISMAVILILVFVAIFLISNTVMIGITVRKEEIAIMKYIGATDIFVRGPFIIEGMTIGLIGSGIPVIVLRILYPMVVDFVLGHFSILSRLLTFMDVNAVFNILIPVSLGIGLGIGFIGSYMTLRKHVKV